MRADRVIYASSAGTGVFNYDDTGSRIDGPGWNNPNPNVQRFSMTAPGDLIGISQSIEADLNPHGQDPDEVAGVTRLDTGYYSANRDLDADLRTELVFGTDGHGQYWNDRDSTAFQNMVGVITEGDVYEYVERGVRSNDVDVEIGDDGDFESESWNAVWGVLDGAYDNPYVTTGNEELGRRIDVK